MKTKTLIPLVLGVVVGGIAIKMVVDAVNRAEGASRADLRKCVVAKMDIDFADEITAEKLTVKDWPKDSLPAEYFSSVEEVEGRVTNIPIPKDVPIYPIMLAAPGTPPGIQTRIKSGYRAVSVEINEVSGVAYMLRPGDRVDVISLVKRRHRDGRRVDTLSRIILQNAEIAAVGRSLSRKGKKSNGKGAMVTRSVTLLLKPDEVTKLHLARENGGRISLALRGSSDDSKREIAGATNNWLLGNDAQQELVEEEQKPAKLASYVRTDPGITFKPKPEPWALKLISGNDIKFMGYWKVNGRWEMQNEVDDSSGQRPSSQPPGANNAFEPNDFD